MAEKVTVLAKYSDFANIFLEELANILSERTGVNKHVIKLQKDKQPPYRFVYSLGPIELKIFKTYIKTILANDFIRASKSLTNALILFVHKLNGSFRLCIGY